MKQLTVQLPDDLYDLVMSAQDPNHCVRTAIESCNALVVVARGLGLNYGQYRSASL